MTGFDFNVDSELAGIRKKSGSGASKPAATPTQSDAPKGPPTSVPETPVELPGQEVKHEEPEGFGIDQSHQETNAGGSPKPRKTSDLVNWKAFKTLRGVFEFVGGERPVILKEPIRRTQVSGIPEPLMLTIQDQLKEKYKGAIVDFPWGPHEIDDRNRVFTAKPTLLRYLLLDGLREGDGEQVQYAKQWLVSHQPAAFDTNFNPANLKPSSDELDIYALLLVAHLSDSGASTVQTSEGDYQTVDQLNLISTNVMRMLDKMNTQELAFEAFAERNDTLQTVVLLDRMGLLKGGLPKDIGAFVRVLEQNRGEVAMMSETVDAHIVAEKERQRTMAREERLKSYARR